MEGASHLSPPPVRTSQPQQPGAPGALLQLKGHGALLSIPIRRRGSQAGPHCSRHQPGGKGGEGDKAALAPSRVVLLLAGRRHGVPSASQMRFRSANEGKG